MNERVVLYVDGGCSGNGQKDCSQRTMISIVTDAAGDVLIERTSSGGGSNNIAELIAVRDALQWCHARKIAAVDIFTDSRNNLAWVHGTKVGQGINNRDWVLQIKDEIQTLRQRVSLTLTWIGRDENKAGHVIEARQGL